MSIYNIMYINGFGHSPPQQASVLSSTSFTAKQIKSLHLNSELKNTAMDIVDLTYLLFFL